MDICCKRADTETCFCTGASRSHPKGRSCQASCCLLGLMRVGHGCGAAQCLVGIDRNMHCRLSVCQSTDAVMGLSHCYRALHWHWLAALQAAPYGVCMCSGAAWHNPQGPSVHESIQGGGPLVVVVVIQPEAEQRLCKEATGCGTGGPL